VNSELTGILRPGDSRWLDPDWFEVTDGEPDLPNSDSNTFQSCATINLSPKGKATLISKLATIDTLRERIWQHGHDLLELGCRHGYEGRPGLRIPKHQRIRHRPDKCSELGCAVSRDWGSFKSSIERQLAHVCHVRFLSIVALEELDKKDASFPPIIRCHTPGKPVVHDRLRSRSVQRGFRSLRSVQLGQRSLKKNGLDEYLTDGGQHILGKWFMVTPSSFALSAHICQQRPNLCSHGNLSTILIVTAS